MFISHFFGILKQRASKKQTTFKEKYSYIRNINQILFI
jgi:hypothetical protein